ncbi:MAG: hypothetical protein QOG84_366 [Sphingomonadales bacterium]|nr:hypothetical protein [Sphingomonadales bacterium]
MFSSAPRPDWLAAQALSKRLRFVDPVALLHLSRGLTFDALQCAEVLDDALIGLDERSGYVTELIHWIRAGALAHRPCPTFPSARIIADVTEAMNADSQVMRMAAVLKNASEAGIAPVVFLSMVSPTLDIGMRVEQPMRALLHGNPPLAGTYTLYLHVLQTGDGTDFVYYGITKRGWSLRFNEHTRAAVASGSKRLFARTLNELIDARVAELSGIVDDRPKLRGLITAVCGTGLSREAAEEAEEAMVEKYSLASRHPLGLNMIPGGSAGISRASRFARRR